MAEVREENRVCSTRPTTSTCEDASHILLSGEVCISIYLACMVQGGIGVEHMQPKTCLKDGCFEVKRK